MDDFSNKLRQAAAAAHKAIGTPKIEGVVERIKNIFEDMDKAFNPWASNWYGDHDYADYTPVAPEKPKPTTSYGADYNPAYGDYKRAGDVPKNWIIYDWRNDKVISSWITRQGAERQLETLQRHFLDYDDCLVLTKKEKDDWYEAMKSAPENDQRPIAEVLDKWGG